MHKTVLSSPKGKFEQLTHLVAIRWPEAHLHPSGFIKICELSERHGDGSIERQSMEDCGVRRTEISIFNYLAEGLHDDLVAVQIEIKPNHLKFTPERVMAGTVPTDDIKLIICEMHFHVAGRGCTESLRALPHQK